MKKSTFLFTGVLFILLSCTTTTNDDFEVHNTDKQSAMNKYSKTTGLVATFADSPESNNVALNEIIIQYAPGVPEVEKEALRNQYNVISTKKCNCTDNDTIFELWIMEYGIEIEPTAKVINQEPDEIVELAVPNYGFDMPMHKLTNFGVGTEAKSGNNTENSTEDNTENDAEDIYLDSSFNTDYLNRIVSSNTGITIAVLDTGLDTQQPGFSNTFLYNATQNAKCNENSGWDFVNNDHNTYDDGKYMHGTVVSHVIHNTLKANGVDHQIMPVKIADTDGKSTYFDTFCGLKYAIEHEVDVINMSFGWHSTSQDVYDLFSDLIQSTTAIMVTSAGNSNYNNDIISHYPSNFPYDHVLSVAAARNDLTKAATYSNYGANTVDFYAIGNKISFPLKTPNTFANFRGTSFAAPYVSARVAELLANGSQQIKVELDQQFGETVPYTSKPVFYMKRIK